MSRERERKNRGGDSKRIRRCQAQGAGVRGQAEQKQTLTEQAVALKTPATRATSLAPEGQATNTKSAESQRGKPNCLERDSPTPTLKRGKVIILALSAERAKSFP